MFLHSTTQPAIFTLQQLALQPINSVVEVEKWSSEESKFWAGWADYLFVAEQTFFCACADFLGSSCTAKVGYIGTASYNEG